MKKFFAVLLCLCMVMTLAPMAAFAESTTECTENCQHEAAIGGTHYDTLADAVAVGGEVELLKSVTLTETLTIASGKPVTLALNGKTISGTFKNTSNSNKVLIDVIGDLTVNGEGTITMNTTGNNMGWNAMSCTIHVSGGDLTINNATIKNEGGTDMAFALDTNPWNSPSEGVLDVVLNGATIESTQYRGVRVRDNGPYLVKFVATDSTIDEIWYQEYSSGDNVNKGNYGVLIEVRLNNTTADVSRVKEAGVLFIDEKPVTVVGTAADLTAAIAAAQPGETIILADDIELDTTLSVPAGKTLTIDGAGYKLTPAEGFTAPGHGAAIALSDFDVDYNASNVYTLKNLTFEGFTGLTRVVRANFADVLLENCVFDGNTVTGGTSGIITSSFSNITVNNSSFTNNVSDFAVLNIGYDVSNGTELLANITGSDFTGNTVNTAVIFAASAIDVTGSYFNGNIHSGDNANAAAVLAGPYTGGLTYNINIKNNAFDEAIQKEGVALPAVFAEDWSGLTPGATNIFDLSNNYWGGTSPAEGTDYVASTEDADVTISSYASSFERTNPGATVTTYVAPPPYIPPVVTPDPEPEVPEIEAPTVDTDAPVVDSTTTENEDGSTTKNETLENGTVIETTTNTDGSKTETATKTDKVENEDGSATTTTTTVTTNTSASGETVKESTQEVKEEKADGSATTTTTTVTETEKKTEKTEVKEEVVVKEDGTTETTTTATTETALSNGSSGTTTTDETGKVEAEVTVSKQAVQEAAEKEKPIELAMPALEVTKSDDETAATVTIDLPTGTTTATVSIPVSEDAGAGTVAVIVNADGTETIITDSNVTENGLEVEVPDGAVIKVVDNSTDFEDVDEDDWHKDAVDFTSSRNIMNGVGGDSFAPETTTTRAMVWTMLARYAGVDTSTGETWDEVGRQWAMENGISDGTMADEEVTREQLVTMIWRFLGEADSDHDLSNFEDHGDTSDWALTAKQWAVEMGIISGVGQADGTVTLDPKGDASRAQVAQIFYNFITKA